MFGNAGIASYEKVGLLLEGTVSMSDTFRAVAASTWVIASCVSGATASDRTPGEQLQALFEDAWEQRLVENPLFATSMGDRRFNHLLPDESLAAYEQSNERSRELLARLEAIARDDLTPAERTNYDIFGRLLRERLAEHGFGMHLMPITNRWGFHIEFPELPLNVPLRTAEDFEDYIARLAAFRTYAAQHMERMRAGIERGLVLPDVVLRDYERPIAAQIVEDAKDSRLFEPFRDMPETIDAADADRLADAARETITDSVLPGYRDFLTFMRDEYVPALRGTIAASALPQGRDFYRHRVRRYTTLDLTPDEVHERGLAEVERIRGEMLEVIRDTGFEGDFAAFVEFLRTDPQFYVETPEALLQEVSFVLKKMDGQLPSLFGTLPRMPYGIREVPEYIAPQTTTAYYQGPSGDGTRAGFYYVNTYDLPSRPLFEVEALSLHEAVPGHHLQIALQQEMEDLPNFRRFAGLTAFIEGWGLYAERLGLECGFYEDPYSNFGRLSYEMWRACRLVVDTGMHYFGWSRQRAIDFMAENTALTLHNITAEVDRYISWPGQAVAYKTGELKIRSLRAVAEERLGAPFDVRQFHDIVLGSGAVPLEILERNVLEWIEEVGKTDAETGLPDGKRH